MIKSIIRSDGFAIFTALVVLVNLVGTTQMLLLHVIENNNKPPSASSIWIFLNIFVFGICGLGFIGKYIWEKLQNWAKS